MSIGKFLESLSQQTLVGIILVGRLGVPFCLTARIRWGDAGEAPPRWGAGAAERPAAARPVYSIL